MYIPIPKLTTAFLTLFVIAMAGCGSDSKSIIETQPSEVDLAIQHSINGSIVLAVTEFNQSIVTLNESIDNFCGDKSTVQLEALQASWKSSFITWYKVLPFKFGPLANSDNSSAILDYIDSYRNATPANRISNLTNRIPLLTSLITAGDAITINNFSNSRPKDVGLLMLESAIFSTITNNTSNVNIATEYTNTPKKCDIIQALGQELINRASHVEQQWNTDYRDTGKSYEFLFTNNELENYFSVTDVEGDGTGKPASEDLIVSIQEFLDFTGNAELFTELAIYSDTIWSALDASINIIDGLLDQSSQSQLTLLSIIKNNGYEQDVSTIKENIAFIKQSIIDKNKIDFIAAIRALDGNFKTSVLNGLNINKGLTFSDGDS